MDNNYSQNKNSIWHDQFESQSADSNNKNWGKWTLKIIVGLAVLFFITKSCTGTEDDAYHNAINSTNIELAEKYLKDYPKGEHVAEIKKHIADYKEYQRYKDNSLYTGSLPYSEYYGRNYSSWLDNGSKITVTAPINSDVIVTARRTSNDRVEGHIYIRKGETASFVFPAGTYTIFFYYGLGWNPNKVITGKHGIVRGGFLSMTTVGKDENVYYPANGGYSYTLQLQENGNFSTQHSSENEMF